MSKQIDDVLLLIRQEVFSMTQETRETELALDPLIWYINTGRAPTDFLKKLITCSPHQIASIAQRLMKNKYVYDDAINSVCACIGFRRFF